VLIKKIKQILTFFTNDEKKNLFNLIFLVLLMASIEAIGIATIFPFIAILTNRELIETNNFISFLFDFSKNFGVNTVDDFFLFLGIIVFLFLITSIFLRAFATYKQTNFALIKEYSIGKKLVEKYLHQPYVWFLDKNSSNLGKNILSEVGEVIHQTILPIINIFVYGFVVIAIFLMLILVDPTIAIAVTAIFSIIYLIIIFITKKILFRLGTERMKANTDRYKAISDAFNGIKDVKINSLEKFFLDIYSKPAKTFVKNQSMFMAISVLPRFLLEAIAFGGIILIILMLLKRGDDLNALIPLLSLFAFAGYRLMPALQQIYISLSQLQFSETVVNSIYKDYTTLTKEHKNFLNEENDKIDIKLRNYIKLENVSFSYRDSKRKAIENVNITIPAFTKIGIVGITGSGKTTLVDIILSLIKPDVGSLLVDGLIIDDTNKRQWQKNFGYVPQKLYLTEDTIAANIAFGENKSSINMFNVQRAAKIAGIHEFVNEKLPNKYETLIGDRGIKFSGGEQQRIGIARALYNMPNILILDEATSSLDNYTEKLFMNMINNFDKNVTIIIVAHRLETIKHCDKIFLFNNGKLVNEGTFDSLSINSDDFKKFKGQDNEG
jgi:ABC-type multidrug transport system fused ATPase/permease subunit